MKLTFNQIFAIATMLIVWPLSLAALWVGEADSMSEVIALITTGPIIAIILWYSEDFTAWLERR